jgi:hypothetical protein
MDEAVDQVMGRSTSETGADKAVAIRRSQQKERSRLQSEIAAEQKVVAQINEERAPIAAEVRKVEAEVGPLKYIAAFVYGANPDSNMLEKAVTWVIIMIVVVFDPLAVIMLLAAQMSFAWHNKGQDPLAEEPVYVADVGEPPTAEEIVEDVAPEETVVAQVEEEPTRNFDWPPVSNMWPFPTHTATPSGDISSASRFGLEQEFLDKVEKGEITFEGDEEIVVKNEEVDADLDRWNKMIQAAEAEVAKTNAYDTIADRLARGESYVSSDGTEETAVPEEPATKILAMGIDDVERPGDYLPLGTPNLELKKKTYMTKDQTGSVVVKSIP